MKLDKKTVRGLSLAFFISGIIVAGANIFAADPSAQTGSSEHTENSQVAEVQETEENEEKASEQSHENSNLAEETESTEESIEEDTSSADDTSGENDIEGEETDENGIIEVVINPNEDSYLVVDKLVQADIVENADEFNEFLDHYDYARRIQPGTKELSPAMSYEEIAQILTTY